MVLGLGAAERVRMAALDVKAQETRPGKPPVASTTSPQSDARGKVEYVRVSLKRNEDESEYAGRSAGVKVKKTGP